VKPAPFAYHRAASLDDAAKALADTGGKVLAGGQSLVPLLSMRLAAPPALVDLNHVVGLDAIDVADGGVRIGALVRHAALEQDETAYAANPLLRRTLRHVAHATIRNRGTTVGSLVHADPAAEMPAVLALLGGHVDATSRDRGTRRIAADDFFVGPLESALEPDEIAVSAFFPDPPAGAGTSWVELSRRHGDYAMVGVGAVVRTEASDPAITVGASVALISVGLTPVVVDLTDVVAGSPSAGPWHDALDLVTAAIEPEADIHATAEYRGHLARVLTARALAAAAADVNHRPAGRPV
jgi:carbon-monoxide dehydrogenase medium subunit